MPTWKASPPIMQDMMIRLRTHLYSNQLMLRSAFFWFAARDQIRSRSPYGVFDHVCQERRENDTDQEPKDSDMHLVEGRAQENSPEAD